MSGLSVALGVFTWANIYFKESITLPPRVVVASVLSFRSSTSTALRAITISIEVLASSKFLLIGATADSVSSFYFATRSAPLPELPWPGVPVLVLVLGLLFTPRVHLLYVFLASEFARAFFLVECCAFSFSSFR